MIWAASSTGVDPSVFAQYGIVGIFLFGALGIVRYLYLNREKARDAYEQELRDRIKDLDEENSKLRDAGEKMHETQREQYATSISALQAVTDALSRLPAQPRRRTEER